MEQMTAKLVALAAEYAHHEHLADEPFAEAVRGVLVGSFNAGLERAKEVAKTNAMPPSDSGWEEGQRTVQLGDYLTAIEKEKIAVNKTEV